jgi:peptidoglycan hydrolase-like protein with peptidoglycan-binding domain
MAARVTSGALAALTVSAVAAGTVVLVNQFGAGSSADTTAAAATNSANRSAPASAPVSNASIGGRNRSATGTPPASTPPSLVAVPLHVVNVAPAGGQLVDGTAAIVVTFDEPVSTTVLPSLDPSTPGTWSQPTPTSLRFDPDVPFLPDTSVRVDVPAGMRADNGGTLATGTTASFHIADGSLLRLQQLLAELDYLPVQFNPTFPEPHTAAAQGAMAFDPPDGAFSMRWDDTPAALASLWDANTLTPVTSGAIMAFENVHQLAVDGDAGPAVWAALLSDAVNDIVDPQPYTWAWTTMSHPETLRIWSNGAFVFSTPANTGIPAAPTPKGSWPVFSRFRSQTMKGTNPDGTKYNDPGVPYINYFHGGDAIHGFERASYGSAQSLGCIELPYTAAAKVWDLIDYGTVVTVTS